MWSIGVILFILLSGDFPFSEEPKKEVNLFASEQWSSISDSAKHLVSQLLEEKVEKRINATAALKHPWIASSSASSSSSYSSSSSLVDSSSCAISGPMFDDLSISAQAIRYKNSELGKITVPRQNIACICSIFCSFSCYIFRQEGNRKEC